MLNSENDEMKDKIKEEIILKFSEIYNDNIKNPLYSLTSLYYHSEWGFNIEEQNKKDIESGKEQEFTYQLCHCWCMNSASMLKIISSIDG
jgi:hypothetical protein